MKAYFRTFLLVVGVACLGLLGYYAVNSILELKREFSIQGLFFSALYVFAGFSLLVDLHKGINK